MKKSLLSIFLLLCGYLYAIHPVGHVVYLTSDDHVLNAFISQADCMVSTKNDNFVAEKPNESAKLVVAGCSIPWYKSFSNVATYSFQKAEDPVDGFSVTHVLNVSSASPRAVRYESRIPNHHSVAFDAKSSVALAGGNPITLPHVMGTADNGYIAAISSWRRNQSADVAVTFNAVSLTNRLLADPGSTIRVRLSDLVAPASGTHDLVFTFDAAVNGAVGAISATGVDQTTPRSTDVTNTGSSTSLTTGAITTTTGELVIAGVGWDAAAGALTPDATWTTAWNTLDGVQRGGSASYVAGSGSSVSYTGTLGSSSDFGAVASSLKASCVICYRSAYTSAYQTASSSYTLSILPTASNRACYFGVSMLSVGGSSVTSIVTTGGTVTKLDAIASVSGAVRAELWELPAPSAVTQTVTITLSAALDSITGAVCLSGVNQSLPHEGTAKASDTNVGAADATVNVVSVAANDWFVGVVATDDTAITPSLTSRWNSTGALGSGSGETTGPKVTPGTQAVGWTAVGALATWSVVATGVRDTNSSDASTSNLKKKKLSSILGIR